MTFFADELKYVRYGLEELEHYLLSKELFWPVLIHPATSSSGYPKLTLGNMLLSLQSIEALSAGQQLKQAEEAEYHRLKTEVEAVHHKWAVAWGEKAAHEYVSRLNQWGEVLDEIHENPHDQAAFYHSGVRLRVLLELLEADVPEGKRPEIGPVDFSLKAIFEPGDFIWEEELKPGFPEDKFWFLYGGIQVE